MKIKATEELELNDSPEINWIAPQKQKQNKKQLIPIKKMTKP